MAMAGSTAVLSLASDDILGINSSGSSGGRAATVSMTRSAVRIENRVWLLRLETIFLQRLLEGYGARIVIKLLHAARAALKSAHA